MSDSSEPPSPDTQAPPQEHLSALDAISTMLTRSSFDLDALLDEVVRITAETMNVFGCAVRLLNDETMQMELKAVYGLSDRFLSKGPIIARKSVYQEMIEKRTESGETVEIYDVREDPRVQYAQAATEEGIHSVLATPLLHDEEVIGALTVFTDRPHRFQEQEVRTFQAIANQAAAAIHLARLHQSELELRRIEEELRIASNIQAQLMPTSNPELEGIEIAGWNRPCFDVGGDFYDFIELPRENLGVAVGDVSGKGIPAALLMVTLRTSLRVQAENVYAMAEVMQRVNQALYHDSRREEFATLFYATLDRPTRTLTFVNAGHNHPILVREGECRPLRTGGLPLGLFPDAQYSEEQIQLKDGDVVLIYTDGFTEVPNADGEEFGRARLQQLVWSHRNLSAEKLVALLEDRVAAFAGDPDETGYEDDRTAVAITVPSFLPG